VDVKLPAGFAVPSTRVFFMESEGAFNLNPVTGGSAPAKNNGVGRYRIRAALNRGNLDAEPQRRGDVNKARFDCAPSAQREEQPNEKTISASQRLCVGSPSVLREVMRLRQAAIAFVLR
jgi:hypothetical protein